MLLSRERNAPNPEKYRWRERVCHRASLTCGVHIQSDPDVHAARVSCRQRVVPAPIYGAPRNEAIAAEIGVCYTAGRGWVPGCGCVVTCGPVPRTDSTNIDCTSRLASRL